MMGQDAQRKYSEINLYIHFFMAMALGGACEYFGLAISFPSLFFIKAIPIYEESQNRKVSKEEEKFFDRATKIALGGILGSVTGFVFFPILFIILTKLKDRRLQLNKNCLYISQMVTKKIPFSLYIVVGVLIGKLVVFLDIQMLKAILLIGSAVMILLTQAKEFDLQKQFTKLQGKQIVQNEQQYCIQFFESILIGYLLSAYSFVNISVWLCFAYIAWLLISKKVYDVLGFKFQSQSRSVKQIIQNSKAELALVTLTCPISSQLIQNPYTIKECGHTFQKSQIKKSLQIRYACPLCNTRTLPQNIVENKMMKKVLRRLEKQLGVQTLGSL